MAYSPIERPEARYRIIYGKHSEIIPCSELFSQCDGLLFEEARWRYGGIEIGDGFLFKDSSIYSKIIEWAQKREVKIYFGDVPPREIPLPVEAQIFNPPLDWQLVLKVAEMGIGGALAGSLAKEIDQGISQKGEVSRRDFLRWLGKGTIAAWNLSFLSKLGAVLMKEGEEIPRFLEKGIAAEDRFHPEFLVVWLRNAVIAKKLIAIGKKEQAEHDRKAEVVAVFGGGHTGLADFLRRGEEACERVVRLYPKWFLEAMIAEGNLDYISLIIGAKFNPKYNLWVITDRFFDEGLYNLVNREQEYSSFRKEIK